MVTFLGPYVDLCWSVGGAAEFLISQNYQTEMFTDLQYHNVWY